MVNWIINLACKVGLHNGDWVHGSAEQCNQARICRDCGARGLRVKHDVRDWDRDGPHSIESYGNCERWGKRKPVGEILAVHQAANEATEVGMKVVTWVAIMAAIAGCTGFGGYAENTTL